MDVRRRRLEGYTEAMKQYLRRYDGTEKVTTFIEMILTDTERQYRRICDRVDDRLVQRNPTVLGEEKDWCETFSQNPRLHLRLTLSLDLSFSRGDFPTDSDFPKGLRANELQDPPGVDDHLVEVNYAETDVGRAIRKETPTLPPITWTTSDDEESSDLFSPLDNYVNLDFMEVSDQQNHQDSSRIWVEEESAIMPGHFDP